MTRDKTNWLREVLRLGRRILEMVEGIEFQEYQSAEWPRIGVERYLISLGEASRAALNDDPDLQLRIPALVEANDMRNFLTHVYLRIDDFIVWNAVTQKLPELLDAVQQVIDEREA